MRIYVYFAGKPRDEHANALAAEFLKRTSRWAKCEMREVNPQRAEFWEKHPTAAFVLLDPAGKRWDSAEFAARVREWEDQSRDVVFVLGGHDGLPEAWRGRATVLLSLSPMTFPHELARAMLAEQIYRAFATLRGHPYPR
ncbi:MAG: 23S rRNA (pseudouridine(1915)-N(3))-methyltransferase RlmH [Bryobacterales bacterium]|nr:23S rRNA (pseudouridine(1915)-N(3))-methyltransferase RlmH [Bryobacterales bacterium]